MKRQQQKGFTLVELSIVLVIIGLILGMAFKGRALIDQAKVKSIQAQYSKILGGFNMFYDRYGFYPGDGCTLGANTVKPSECPASATRNGTITTGVEAAAAIPVLVGSTLLTGPDVASPSGQAWNVSVGAAAPYAIGVVYLTINAGAGGVPTAAVDPRYACALDRLMDDGVSTTGDVRSSGGYNATTDCWDQVALPAAGVGQALVSLGIRMLP